MHIESTTNRFVDRNHSQQNDNEMRLTLVGSSFLDSRRLAGRRSSPLILLHSKTGDKLCTIV
ncbi:hypothetical protein [Methanolobus bombayensis]|uniref:hypothetical protein n=1 Tax=Methanolobus bombayensis TaxID=38023 RepID=UPI001AE24F6E|nr:hypothetical protein [Methanolobus bombayensis]MBP1910598.1 hypothetical protein [Methanolobus bombayensis]